MSDVIGRRFTHVYGQKGAPVQDSQRARRRLQAALTHLWPSATTRAEIAKLLLRELGTVYPRNGNPSEWTYYYEKESISDVLDGVTVVFSFSNASTYFQPVDDWVREVRRVFDEENLAYTVDDRGGVRYRVDEQLERSLTATVSGLGLPRYRAALEAFEGGQAALRRAAPDTLNGVRLAFDAVENVFKLMTGESRIGSGEIAKRLGPELEAAYSGRALNAARLVAKAMGEWVNACHQYRHAPGEEEPSPPPIGVALVLISSAAAHLRWLVELDQAT